MTTYWCSTCARYHGEYRSAFTDEPCGHGCDVHPRMEPIPVEGVVPPVCYTRQMTMAREAFLLLPLAVARAAADAAIYGLRPGRPSRVGIAVDPATRVLRLVEGAEADALSERWGEDDCPYLLELAGDGMTLMTFYFGFGHPLDLPGHPEVVAIRYQQPCNFDDYGEAAMEDLRASLGLPDDWAKDALFGIDFSDEYARLAPFYPSLADADPVAVDAWVRRWSRPADATHSYWEDPLLLYADAEAAAIAGIAWQLEARLVIEGVDREYDSIAAQCAAGEPLIAYNRFTGTHGSSDEYVYLPKEEA